jgi:hypothetical protein
VVEKYKFDDRKAAAAGRGTVPVFGEMVRVVVNGLLQVQTGASCHGVIRENLEMATTLPEETVSLWNMRALRNR